ncbi:MAG: M20 family metallo-hydrolase [Solirubrobacteraceae bacterium]
MDLSLEHEQFSGDSVVASLDALARFGGATDGSVTRVAWSGELFDAYRWTGDRMRELGLAVEIDPAGNLLGRWEVGKGKPLLVGSHLDSVPSGGHLDGVLGVVAAVHAVALLKERGYEPPRPVWIIAFMDEEGARFDTALFGSRAFAGDDLSGLGDRSDAAGVTLREAMAGAGYDFDRVADAARADEVGAYLELHIEQGPVLDHEHLEIGVVTSIVGLRGFRVRMRGQANHAGTTPMRLRRDAFIGAARVALALREEACHRETVTANIGKVTVAPGGANVVPGLADFTIDARATTSTELREIEEFIRVTVARVAEEERLDVDLEPTFALDPLQLAPEIVDAVERAARTQMAAVRRMPSGAGHDAQVIGRHVPAGMLFIPSLKGISHSPDEETLPQHVELGVCVLAQTITEMLA